MKFLHIVSLTAALGGLGCSSGGSQPATADGGGGGGNPSADASPGGNDVDAAGPDVTLTDIHTDLNALLENGELVGACERYWASPDTATRREMLLCGKQMFFYESFDGLGMPRSLIELMIAELPQTVGPGFEAFGMIPDPTSDTDLPLGFAAAPNYPDSEVQSLAYTCASCHFGRTSDGRYVVGLANHDYDYGGQIVATSLFPTLALGLDQQEHPPQAMARLQPLLDEYAASPTAGTALLGVLLELAGLGADAVPAFEYEHQAYYSSWKTGNQDFLMTPLPLDDDVHVVGKIISLFDIPTLDAAHAAGMPDALLAWSGGADSLEQFLGGFVAVAGADPDAWPADRLQPLAEYIYTLRAPPILEALDPAELTRGEVLFTDLGCDECHDGPGGSGTEVYSFDDIGTDDALRYIADPDLDGVSNIDNYGDADGLTHGVKSPRLSGLWALGRYLHNGSVDSFEALFCLGSDRPTIAEHVYSDRGHRYTCDDISDDDKRALITYLRSL